MLHVRDRCQFAAAYMQHITTLILNSYNTVRSNVTTKPVRDYVQQ